MRIVIALMLVAGIAAGPAARAAENQPTGDDSRRRVAYRPVARFNVHLYGAAMRGPTAVAYDQERKEIWIAESGEAGIGVFRPDGAELFSFLGGPTLRDPSCIAVTPEGDLGVIEGTREKIRLFSYRGEHMGTLDLEKIGERPVLGAITWDRFGNLYVADNASAQIFVYGRSGRLKFRFGSRGSEEGQFTSIVGLAIGLDGRIYVADARVIAVQVFDNQGNFLRGWGEHATGSGNFSLPSGIAVDSKGRVVVSDALRHEVKVFDSNGTLIASFGGLGDGLGQMAFPSAVATDEKDRIIVAEKTTSRVQIFEPIEIDR